MLGAEVLHVLLLEVGVALDLVDRRDEMAAIDSLDTSNRGGPEPGAITLQAFGREIPEA